MKTISEQRKEIILQIEDRIKKSLLTETNQFFSKFQSISQDNVMLCDVCQQDFYLTMIHYLFECCVLTIQMHMIIILKFKVKRLLFSHIDVVFKCFTFLILNLDDSSGLTITT